jgi:hypothetical protein
MIYLLQNINEKEIHTSFKNVFMAPHNAKIHSWIYGFIGNLWLLLMELQEKFTNLIFFLHFLNELF